MGKASRRVWRGLSERPNRSFEALKYSYDMLRQQGFGVLVDLRGKPEKENRHKKSPNKSGHVPAKPKKENRPEK